MSTDRQTITIYMDEQDPQNRGWAYRIDGGASGAIDGDAADAVQMIVDGVEGADLDALRDAIEWRLGDLVAITGPGMPGSLGDLLDIAGA